MPAAAPKGEESELAGHRAAIDALDREILGNLNARAKHAKAIGELKEGSAAYRPEREAQVLTRLAAANAGPLSDTAVTGVFREIMSACLALEQKLRIAYLGPAGTFSHAAVAKHFGSFVDTAPHSTIDEIFRAVESGQTDYAVVPVENSTEGALGRTLDLMCTTDLSVCGEVKLRIQQNLLSNARSLSDVARIYSHAQSLAQCVHWLATHVAESEEESRLVTRGEGDFAGFLRGRGIAVGPAARSPGSPSVCSGSAP
jgi:chorismate mutase/prephenate dehydratase